MCNHTTDVINVGLTKNNDAIKCIKFLEGFIGSDKVIKIFIKDLGNVERGLRNNIICGTIINVSTFHVILKQSNRKTCYDKMIRIMDILEYGLES